MRKGAYMTEWSFYDGEFYVMSRIMAKVEQECGVHCMGPTPDVKITRDEDDGYKVRVWTEVHSCAEGGTKESVVETDLTMYFDTKGVFLSGQWTHSRTDTESKRFKDGVMK